MKYIKRTKDKEGYITNCFSHAIMLTSLMLQKKERHPLSSEWILDRNRYELHNTKTLKDFYWSQSLVKTMHFSTRLLACPRGVGAVKFCPW